MKLIEIYIHTTNGIEPKLIRTSEDATVKQLIETIVEAGELKTGQEEDIRLFLEDSDEPVEMHRKLSECEIRHRHHVHCHRCHRVKVSVFYNGEKHESFPPSATVKRILKWAIKAFNITPADAADMVLALKGNVDNELPLDAHIGSFTHHNECAVSLCLTAPVEVNG